MFAIMNTVPAMPMTGITGPPGTLNARGALGKRRRSTSTSMSAKMYETSHSTVTTRIRNEMASDDPPLKYAMRQIEIVTKRMATAGAP